jgi:hypothetical protein
MHSVRYLVALLGIQLLALGCPDDVTGDDEAWSDDDAGDDDTVGDDGTGSDDDDAGDDDTISAQFTGDLYAHTSSALFEVLPHPPYTLTLVGNFVNAPADGITDIAINTDGTLYACGFYDVFRVDPVDLELIWLASPGIVGLNALTALADGKLATGTSESGTIYSVDPASGTVSQFGNTPGWLFAGDMVGLPDGLLYSLMAEGYAANPTSLVVYDPATHQFTEVGATGFGAMYGLGYSAQTLLGFTVAGEIMEIDQQTGVAAVVATTGMPFWGAATNPMRWD